MEHPIHLLDLLEAFLQRRLFALRLEARETDVGDDGTGGLRSNVSRWQQGDVDYRIGGERCRSKIQDDP